VSELIQTFLRPWAHSFCLRWPELTRRLGRVRFAAGTEKQFGSEKNMSTILDSINTFVGQLGIGLLPLPPKSDTLDGHVPNLEGLLSREDAGIICQLQDNKSLDGGDSAHRTGIAAFYNSGPDSDLLNRFETGGKMVRHPTQEPWNNWKNCTRDQLIGYVAGCWRAGRLDINQRLLQAHAARNPPFTCQNTENDKPGSEKKPPVGDLLLPDDVMFLRIGAGENAAYTDMLGQFTLQVLCHLPSQSTFEGSRFRLEPERRRRIFAGWTKFFPRN
jgi:hypothetical protein